jgi:SAM-dependent methyltransferase
LTDLPELRGFADEGDSDGTGDGLPDDPTQRMAVLYSRLAQAYARLWSPVIRPMALPLLRALPLHSAQHVLDVGTGVGALIPDIRASAPSADIVGVDQAEGMLRLAQENGNRFNVSIALMDAQYLAIESGIVDVAIMAFVLFHISDPQRALIEVKRVLRPGGTIGTVTWGGTVSFPAEVVWDEELAAHGAVPDPASPIRYDDLMDTPDKIGTLLEGAGFEEVNAWKQSFEYQWKMDRFFALRMEYGAQRRRLDTLQPAVRAACLQRIRERLSGMSQHDYFFTPEIVFATATSAATASATDSR